MTISPGMATFPGDGLEWVAVTTCASIPYVQGARFMAYHRFDAVIVGAGGAGLMAAIQMAGKANVAVVNAFYEVRP